MESRGRGFRNADVPPRSAEWPTPSHRVLQSPIFSAVLATCGDLVAVLPPLLGQCINVLRAEMRAFPRRDQCPAAKKEGRSRLGTVQLNRCLPAWYCTLKRAALPHCHHLPAVLGSDAAPGAVRFPAALFRCPVNVDHFKPGSRVSLANRSAETVCRSQLSRQTASLYTITNSRRRYRGRRRLVAVVVGVVVNLCSVPVWHLISSSFHHHFTLFSPKRAAGLVILRPAACKTRGPGTTRHSCGTAMAMYPPRPARGQVGPLGAGCSGRP